MKQLHRLVATAALVCAGVFASAAAQAVTVVVDVSGAQSINLQGEAGNTVLLRDVGAHSVLTAIDWSVTLNALAPSLLSEMQVSFGNSSGTDAINLAPGGADNFSGSGDYTGSIDLTGLGIGAGADGVLRIEFSETYKDFAAGAAEGQWLAGSLRFEVSPIPEPAGAALALLGLGLLGVQLRRTRRAS